jgi:hypothetical protein
MSKKPHIPFPLHIPDAVKMDHERNRCDHDQHHYRNGIEKDAKVNVQLFGKFQPNGIVTDDLLESLSGLGNNKKVLVGSIIG